MPSVEDMLVLSTYQCWAGTDHGSHQGGVSGFITMMGGSLIFSKNRLLQVFEKSEPKNLPVQGIWGKRWESKNNHPSASDVSKPSKRTSGLMKEPLVLCQFFDLRTISSFPVL